MLQAWLSETMFARQRCILVRLRRGRRDHAQSTPRLCDSGHSHRPYAGEFRRFPPGVTTPYFTGDPPKNFRFSAGRRTYTPELASARGNDRACTRRCTSIEW